MNTPAIMARFEFDRDGVREIAHYYAASILASDKYNLRDIEPALRLGYLDGREAENAQLRSLLEQVLALNGKLEMALEEYANEGGVTAHNALAENAAAMKGMGK
jgi:hypothetical protein